LITVVNRSTLVSSADVQLMTRACAYQLRYHAAPAWGKNIMPVVYAASEATAPPGSWVIGVFDDADQAGALGWHDLGAGDVVYGRVFARPVLDHGGNALTRNLSVASVLSHEVLETFVDPYCNLYADRDGRQSIAVEVGDPVEADSYVVPVSGSKVTVSNFVFPRWFDPQATDGPFDQLGRLHGPFTMTSGGYLIVMQDGRVSQVFGSKHEEWRTTELKQSPLSRTARRMALAVARPAE
jgi:hypothetical protein